MAAAPLRFLRASSALLVCVAMAAGALRGQARQTTDRPEGVVRQSPGADAAPEALFSAAQAARLDGRPEDAATRFVDVATRYPSSPLVPRSLLAAASSLVAAGQPTRAFEPLQRLRNQFPTAPEATTAAELITTLYRFYLRAPAQPPYVYSTSIAPTGGRIRDFRELGAGAGNHLFVATKSALLEFGPAGEVVRSTDMPDSRGVIIDRAGRPMVIGEDGGLRAEGQPVLSLATARPDGKIEAVRVDAGVVTSTGDVIVTNRDQKTLVRFGVDGKPKGEFARAIATRRLAVDDLDQVAALDSDAKAVVLFGRDGKVVARLPERGTGYQFRQPTDIAFDRLGHLYVLDRAALYVFTPQRTLLTTFTVADKSAGAFSNAEALALDSAARLFIFDSRADAVQVYR
jgi:hypothetical protein